MAWQLAFRMRGSAPAALGWQLACLVVLRVGCHLRPGAAVALRRQDVLPPAPEAGAAYNARGL
eukprot:8504698-Lingulodinium_polyedra.AAC.1